MDLEEVHGGGAGNVPIIGQYIGAMALMREPAKTNSKKWKLHHSYIIDSAGVARNPSRLFFYVFSAGGGSGSGMAGEFGAAQQAAFRARISSDDDSSSKQEKRNVFEPIYSAGVAILPHDTTDEKAQGQAHQINAGRLITRYLAEQYRSMKPDAWHNSMRPFNSMILISNDIMKFALYSKDKERPIDVDTAKMENLANQYVSQQIFNILTAQAPISDYDSEYFWSAGIDVGETIKLDPNDLGFSLTGPVVVAYSETPASSSFRQQNVKLNMNDMLRRAVSLPTVNSETSAIEGISVLPEEADSYRARLGTGDHTNWSTLGSDVNLFLRAQGVVAVVSLPTGVRLPYKDLSELKDALRQLFPNAKLIRYALVLGASPHVGLSVLISQSAPTCDEIFHLLTNFVKHSMSSSKEKDGEEDKLLEDEVIDFLDGAEGARERLILSLTDKEDPSAIMNEN